MHDIENLVTQTLGEAIFNRLVRSLFTSRKKLTNFLAKTRTISMKKKESYRNNLPHFQQPGQMYFVTWNLKDAVPRKALKNYTQKLEQLKNQIDFHRQQDSESTKNEELKREYQQLQKKYKKAYDDLLAISKNNITDLSQSGNTQIISEALLFWENKKLKTFAYSIMPNHVHWVIALYEKDENGKPVYLQDILQSVKRHTANRINKREGKQGNLWQKESFDTTIRDEKHLQNAVEYTLNNPCSAGLVKDRNDWAGNYLCPDYL